MLITTQSVIVQYITLIGITTIATNVCIYKQPYMAIVDTMKRLFSYMYVDNVWLRSSEMEFSGIQLFCLTDGITGGTCYYDTDCENSVVCDLTNNLCSK